jgi:hypothetical protein
MQRIAQKLEPLLDAPTLASSPSEGLAAGPLGKIALIVLAVGALFAFLPRLFPSSSTGEHAPAIEAARPAGSGQRAPETATVTPTPVAAIRPPSVQTVASSTVPSVETIQPTDSAPARYALRKRAVRASSASPLASTREPRRTGIAAAAEDRPTEAFAASPHGSTDPVPSESPTAVPTDANATTTTQRAAEAPPASVLAAPPAQSGARKAPSATVALDEAAMLQRARRLAHDRPADALRLLDEHKRRFAQGMLAPEREVMAIEILRAQSRSSEATLRLNAFRQHYPDSVYLQRLDHPGPRP